MCNFFSERYIAGLAIAAIQHETAKIWEHLKFIIEAEKTAT